jgi:hypothetical protein
MDNNARVAHATGVANDDCVRVGQPTHPRRFVRKGFGNPGADVRRRRPDSRRLLPQRRLVRETPRQGGEKQSSPQAFVDAQSERIRHVIQHAEKAKQVGKSAVAVKALRK